MRGSVSASHLIVIGAVGLAGILPLTGLGTGMADDVAEAGGSAATTPRNGAFRPSSHSAANVGARMSVSAMAGKHKNAPAPVVYLDQGWTEKEREAFYTLSQGSQLVPYSLLASLEQGDSNKRVVDPAYLAKFNLSPSPYNHDGFPIGVSATVDPGTGGVMAGATCAYCHTSEITYKGTRMRIDGAAGAPDNIAYANSLFSSVKATLKNPWKLTKFLVRTLKFEVTHIRSFGGVKQFFKNLWGIARNAPDFVRLLSGSATKDEANAVGGFGRMDAINRAANRLFGDLLDKDNVRPAPGPVRTPALWNTPKFDWMHATGSIGQPLARDVAQAHSSLVPVQYDKKNVSSDLDLVGLRKLEGLVRKLKAPKWPEAILGAIDQEKAARGAVLYNAQCGSCHSIAEVNGELHLPLIGLDEIGTDPVAAESLAERTVDLGKIGGGGKVPLVEAFEKLTQRIIEDRAKRLKFSKAQIAEATEGGPNEWRAPLAYKAKPLDGIWANGPFLHNGSVPSLTELLKPPAERVKTFEVGNREYDPENVGFRTEATKNSMTFDTALPGNSNAGHDYGTQLSESDRNDLIEYLKTL